MTLKIVPVILSGGSGTRLWPLSRKMRPKQFINLLGRKSLFQSTLDRISGIQGIGNPIVVCNNEHRFVVAEQLREMDVQEYTIILEPFGKNTAPAIASAALSLTNSDDSEHSIMLVLPADHVIGDVGVFHSTVENAVNSVDEGQLVTFGIKPTYAATGFGYLSASEQVGNDLYKVDRFVEKPDVKTAESYFQDGSYYWNSGMFLMKPDLFLRELEQHAPEVLEHTKQALLDGTLDHDFFRLSDARYKMNPDISVDYAVMEKSDRVIMTPLDARWSDVGSWSSVWAIGEKDENGNSSKGDVWMHDVKNSYLHAENKIIAAIGVEDLIIVETLDGVMVTRKGCDQDVKHIVTQLVNSGRPEALLHRKVYRPWGYFDSIDQGERFQVKRIFVKPGQVLSLQKHFHRAEHWVVVSGTAEITCNGKIFNLTENQSTHIPLGAEHRLRNPGKIPLEIIEIQSGSYLGEDDIVRLDDTYGRANQ